MAIHIVCVLEMEPGRLGLGHWKCCFLGISCLAFHELVFGSLFAVITACQIVVQPRDLSSEYWGHSVFMCKWGITRNKPAGGGQQKCSQLR